MITFDQATVDSSGAFLIGELERLDQTLNLPLVGYTWSRDIQLLKTSPSQMTFPAGRIPASPLRVLAQIRMEKTG
ncbi:bacteriophage protein [Escherichia coli]|uniref:Bacteriophage protein n=1 Tax=Escherichia coli TaxID=562 RepID=A0A376P764_ECOLX|nr:bacteriophage protein [Escherichia coli]